jgi:hypothetical protein
VRTIALRTLLASHDDANTELATTALLDLQSSVRDIAAAFLRTAGFDLREFYRGVLQRQFRPQVKLIQVALTSLAALRSEEDIVLVKEHVAHERISVRKTALASWLKLSPQDKDEIAARALADQGAPVRKLALQIVRKHGAYIPFSSVRRRLSEIGDLSLLLQFAQSRVWDGLECIVQEGMRDMTEAGRKALLVEALRDWIARAGHRYEVASASQREWLCSPAAMKVLHDLLDNNKCLIERLNLELST